MKVKEVKQISKNRKKDTKNGLGRGLGRDLGRRKRADPGIAPGPDPLITSAFMSIASESITKIQTSRPPDNI